MPSYNHERYIARSIESVLDQTFPDLELIVVDDASRDGSVEIIGRYLRKDSRVRAVCHESNQGIARTLNEGIELATGQFIAFLASDDVWAEHKLEKQMGVLGRDENMVVWSEGEIIDGGGRPLGQTFTALLRARGKRKAGRIFSELLPGNYIFGSSLIMKRDNLRDIRFDTGLKYLNDFSFYLDLSAKYDFYFFDEPLVRYRLHGTNSTGREPDVWDRETLMMYDRILAKYGPVISKRLRSRLLCLSSLAYSRMGKPGMAIRALCKGIMAYPIHAYYLVLLCKHIARNARGRDYRVT
ncbi:MAG: Glycosyltransferase AglE [Methanocella sp. PtaU1.Bin125]|nr:MAG: Glycosyltransferase AglE [Methanocella sp. PtaU1.Bin125]